MTDQKSVETRKAEGNSQQRHRKTRLRNFNKGYTCGQRSRQPEVDGHMKLNRTMLKSLDYTKAQVERLTEQNKIMREALESVACLGKERQAEEAYWLDVTHKDCAETLAQDTSIARKALAQVKDMDK